MVPPSFARLQRVVATAWSGETPSHVTLWREALSDRTGTTTIAALRVNDRLQDEWASHAACLSVTGSGFDTLL